MSKKRYTQRPRAKQLASIIEKHMEADTTGFVRINIPISDMHRILNHIKNEDITEQEYRATAAQRRLDAVKFKDQHMLSPPRKLKAETRALNAAVWTTYLDTVMPATNADEQEPDA